MMRRFACLTLLWMFSFCVFAAHATTTTYAISFQTNGSAPVSGSYLLTFDPAQNSAANATAGLTVNQLSFNSGPSGYNYLAFYGLLRIGGLLNGVISADAGTDDYVLQLIDFPTGVGATLEVTQSGTSSVTTYDYTNVTATVTQVATTPEPSSLVLLLSGLAGVGTVMRRRFTL